MQTIIVIKNSNPTGEALRERFFKQDLENGIFGCYSTFELRDDVEELPDQSITVDDYEEIATCARAKVGDQVVIMRYYWDGDGYLEFEFADGTKICNHDCKKDYGWERLNKK